MLGLCILLVAGWVGCWRLRLQEVLQLASQHRPTTSRWLQVMAWRCSGDPRCGGVQGLPGCRLRLQWALLAELVWQLVAHRRLACQPSSLLLLLLLMDLAPELQELQAQLLILTLRPLVSLLLPQRRLCQS